jgi:hypothetical protein
MPERTRILELRGTSVVLEAHSEDTGHVGRIGVQTQLVEFPANGERVSG